MLEFTSRLTSEASTDLWSFKTVLELYNGLVHWFLMDEMHCQVESTSCQKLNLMLLLLAVPWGWAVKMWIGPRPVNVGHVIATTNHCLCYWHCIQWTHSQVSVTCLSWIFVEIWCIQYSLCKMFNLQLSSYCLNAKSSWIAVTNWVFTCVAVIWLVVISWHMFTCWMFTWYLSYTMI